MAIKRGERSRSSRQSARSRGRREPPERSGWRLWLRRALVWGGALAVLGLIALGSAVFFAARNMPSYSALMSSQHGQMIVVRARDGSEIV